MRSQSPCCLPRRGRGTAELRAVRIARGIVETQPVIDHILNRRIPRRPSRRRVARDRNIILQDRPFRFVVLVPHSTTIDAADDNRPRRGSRRALHAEVHHRRREGVQRNAVGMQRILDRHRRIAAAVEEQHGFRSIGDRRLPRAGAVGVITRLEKRAAPRTNDARVGRNQRR